MIERQKWQCVYCKFVFDGALPSEANINMCPKCYHSHLVSLPKYGWTDWQEVNK